MNVEQETDKMGLTLRDTVQRWPEKSQSRSDVDAVRVKSEDQTRYQDLSQRSSHGPMVLFFTSSSKWTRVHNSRCSDSASAVNPPATIYMGKDKVESMCQVVLCTRPTFTRTDQTRT